MRLCSTYAVVGTRPTEPTVTCLSVAEGPVTYSARSSPLVAETFISYCSGGSPLERSGSRITTESVLSVAAAGLHSGGVGASGSVGSVHSHAPRLHADQPTSLRTRTKARYGVAGCSPLTVAAGSVVLK